MPCVRVIIVVLLLSGAAARGGFVETLQGVRHEGELSVAGDGSLTVRQPAGVQVRVPLEHVYRAVPRPAPVRRMIDLQAHLSPVHIHAEGGVALAQSATDAINRLPCIFGREGMEGIAGHFRPQPAQFVFTDATSATAPDEQPGWFSGTLTWNLGEEVPVGQRQLDSVSIWIWADDSSRCDFAGSLAVSSDGRRFIEIPGTRFEKEFPRKVRRGSFNRITYSFQPGRVTGFKYLRLIADVPSTGLATRFAEIDAFVSRIDWSDVRVGGVVLRNGTELTGDIVRADRTTVVLARAGRQESIPTGDVAMILFYRVAPGSIGAAAGRTGAVLRGGDFVQGELRSVEGGRVQLSSVLFGLRTLEIASDVLAISLRPARRPEAEIELRTADGSVFYARSLRSDGKTLTLDEVSRGRQQIPVEEVVEIRAGRAQLKYLADLPATSPTTSQGAVAAVWAARIRGRWYDRGIALPVGASATFTIPGGSRGFIVRAGVPEGVPPSSGVRFIVLADGQEIFRSRVRSSQTEPLLICLAIEGRRTLTIRSEPNSPGGDGQVFWAEAALTQVLPTALDDASAPTTQPATAQR